MKETNKKHTFQVLVKRTDNQERTWLELVEVEPFSAPIHMVDLRSPSSQLLH